MVRYTGRTVQVALACLPHRGEDQMNPMRR
jgi:hypothetical protein